MMAPESVPVDFISIRGMGAVEIQSVQIGVMALSVPPGSIVRLGVAHQVKKILVLIFFRKGHVTEMKQIFV